MLDNTLTTTDFAALSPLLIVLAGALIILLIESFSSSLAKTTSLFISLATLALAIFATFKAPDTDNPLITPWLKFDNTSFIFTIFFLVVGLASSLLTSAFFDKFSATVGEFYFLLLSSIFGLILIGYANDFLMIFLGIETLSISLYVLCGYMKHWPDSGEASLKYFLLGAFAAAFMLYGFALIYGATGTTRLDLLLSKYQLLSTTQDKTLFLVGTALITLGLSFKAAVFPFHVWAPDVYDGAPTPVTAFMAVGTKIGAFAAFARIFLIALYQFNPLWNESLSILAYFTLIYANFVALRQVQLRRFFAYSGISHAGFLLLPLIASTPDSLSALLFYLLIYGIATLGCFAVFAFLDKDNGGVIMNDLYGLFKKSPLLAGLLTLCLLTLAGIPPTPGFFAKLYIFKVTFDAGYIPLVIVALLTTILSAYYYLRIIAMMFSEEPVEEKKPLFIWPAFLVGSVCFIALIYLTFMPRIL